jgi:hypothetical protein
MLILIEPRSFWKNWEVEMKANDPCGFALDVGRGMLVCLLPVGSVGVKMMQSQRHALEETKGPDPVELSPPIPEEITSEHGWITPHTPSETVGVAAHRVFGVVEVDLGVGKNERRDGG